MPWQALIAPAISVWSQAVAQAPGPEALEAWKRRLDEGIAAWSAALEKAMATEAFAQRQDDIEDHLAAVEERLARLAGRLEDLFAVLAERDRRSASRPAPGEDE